MVQVIEAAFETSIHSLLDAAATERQLYARHPFFCAVSITYGDLWHTRLTAFCRDIGLEGIGLLSKTPLARQRVKVGVPTVFGRQAHLRTSITWCEPWGTQWYLSGGQFVGLTTLQQMELRMAIGTLRAHRRLRERYSFSALVRYK